MFLYITLSLTIRLASVSLYTVLAVALFSLSLPSYSGQLDRKTYDRIPASIKTWDSRLRFLELNHGYGLFRYSNRCSIMYITLSHIVPGV